LAREARKFGVTIEEAGNLLNLGDNLPDGHHKVVQSAGYSRESVAGQVFNSRTARVTNRYYVNHNGKYLNGVSHPSYTQKVLELAAKNGISDFDALSAEGSFLFLRQVEESNNPFIRSYLRGVTEEAGQARIIGRAFGTNSPQFERWQEQVSLRSKAWEGLRKVKLTIDRVKKAGGELRANTELARDRHASTIRSANLEIQKVLDEAAALRTPRATLRASAEGVTARASAALTVYTTLRAALQEAGAAQPDEVVIPADYYFVADDGSVFVIQYRNLWGLARLVMDPWKQFVAGPRKGETQSITWAKADEYVKEAETIWGHLIPGKLFRQSRFIPGTNRSSLPLYNENGLVGWVDEDGEHYYYQSRGGQFGII
jgi:hypothetical protein